MQQQRSFKQQSTGALYLVPTPIGNLADMTYRAVEVLRESQLILAEDTRNTIKLLNHFAIDTSMRSFHEHTHQHQVEIFVDQLLAGDQLALVSDAGMPLINDPGHPLVQACHAPGVPVVALPGANAALTGLVASGLSADRFTYYGFFPRKKADREELLKMVGERQETAIFYESPYRLQATLEHVAQVLGDEVKMAVARELTKRHEEYLRGSAAELLVYLQKQGVKGECVFYIQGGSLPMSDQPELNLDLSLKDQVLALMEQEACKPNQAIKRVAQLNHLPRQQVYQAYHEL